MFLALVLIRNPIAFLRAISLDFSLAHPRVAFARYVAKWENLYAEAARELLVLEDTWSKGILGAWYTGAHNIARFELYVAGRQYSLEGNRGAYVWRKAFGPVTPGEHQLHELAAVANKIAGTTPLGVLGIPRSQQQLESLLLFHVTCDASLAF